MHAKDISLYISCGLYSSRIRTLVVMATYSSHRLIMGKEEIDNFNFIGDNRFFFCTEMFIELSSMFHTTFVQIAQFDWLTDSKVFFSETVKRMKLKLGILE